MNPLHLAKRALFSIGNASVSSTDQQWIANTLNGHELALWQQFTNPDKRHSVMVARRFMAEVPNASRKHLAGVMLHDIGKIKSNLSTLMRVIATLVGPRGQRFTAYHNHEKVGVQLLREINSEA
ncbi:MAG: hypothetical protein RIS37_1076 [Actinomycetota bacterium]